jgi:hypothetical protein
MSTKLKRALKIGALASGSLASGWLLGHAGKYKKKEEEIKKEDPVYDPNRPHPKDIAKAIINNEEKIKKEKEEAEYRRKHPLEHNEKIMKKAHSEAEDNVDDYKDQHNQNLSNKLVNYTKDQIKSVLPSDDSLSDYSKKQINSHIDSSKDLVSNISNSSKDLVNKNAIEPISNSLGSITKKLNDLTD